MGGLGGFIGEVFGGGGKAPAVDPGAIRRQEEMRLKAEKEAEAKRFAKEEEERKRRSIAERAAFSAEDEVVGRKTLGGS